jgi:hypothetical protein
MADNDDFENPRLIAQADPLPEPRPDLRVVPDRPRRVNPASPPRTTTPRTPTRTPKGGGIITVIDVLLELTVTTPAGAGSAELEWERQNRQRQEQDRLRRERQRQQEPSPTAPPQRKPQSPPVFVPPVEPIPIPTYSPPPKRRKPERVQDDWAETLRRNEEASRRRQAELDRAMAAEAERSRRESERQQNEADRNMMASNVSGHRDQAIRNKVFELRFAALSNSNLSSDELFKLERVWVAREEQINNILSQRDVAFQRWRQKNPSTPEHHWLNGENRRYQNSAVSILRSWVAQDKQAQQRRKVQTAEQINRERQRQRTRRTDPTTDPRTVTNAAPAADQSGNARDNTPKKKKGQPSRWDKAANEIRSDFRRRINAGESASVVREEDRGLETNLESLRAKGLSPEIVTKLSKQGMFPSILSEYCEAITNLTRIRQGRRGIENAVSPQLQELAVLTSKLLEQISKRPGVKNPITQTEEIIQDALATREMHEYIKEIINSGKLRVPEALGKLLNNYNTQTSSSSALGNLFEAEFAARLVRYGHEIGLGQGADVVDHTNRYAWQLKNIDGKNFSSQLNKAALQLKGENGEQPPLGYRRGIQIRITNSQHPDYRKTPKQLEDMIGKSISTDTDNKWGNVNQVQITIGNKTHVFDIKRVRDRIMPSYRRTYDSRGYSTSEAETGTQMVQVPDGSSELQRALSYYQQALNNVPSEANKSSSNDPFASLAITRRLHGIDQNIREISMEVEQNTLQALQQQEQALQATNNRNSQRDVGMGGMG